MCFRSFFATPSATRFAEPRSRASTCGGWGWRISISRLSLLALLVVALLPTLCQAQTNPVPLITEVLPVSTQPGVGSTGAGSDLTLIVLGTGFINGTSAIYWNGAPLPNPTTCAAPNPPVQASCTVVVPAAKIAAAGTANITVVNPNPSPAVGTSNTIYFPINIPTPPISTPRRDISASPTPFNVAVADFNGDGKLDLAFPNFYNGTVTVLLGDGAGNFTPAGSPVPAGTYPSWVVVGDFNGDGKPDLAIANTYSVCCDYQGSAVSTLLGDGTGNFTLSATSGSTEGAPHDMVVGDFNGDGNLDVAALDWNGLGKICVLLGDGTGNFTPTLPGDSNGSGDSFAVGDFNGDGNLDLAIAHERVGMRIYLGDGAGNFTSNLVYPYPEGYNWDGWFHSIAAGDFNGDGKLDLVVGGGCRWDRWDANCNSNPGHLAILLGDGTGNFTPTATPPDFVGRQDAVAVGDFNGDGKPDLAVADSYANTVTILLGDGTGNFMVSPASSGTGLGPVALAVGDLNGDGRLDLVTANYGATYGWNENAPGSISILMQAPDLTVSKTHAGNFTQAPGQTYTITATNSGSVPTTGTVTVTDTLPSGLTATAMAGAGWDCSYNPFPVAGNGTATVSCTRTDALAPGASYPSITLTVDVASGAPSSVTNTATVSGGGEGDTSNDTATDPTTIVIPTVTFSAPSLTFPAQLVGSTSVSQTITLTNGGTATLNIAGVVASGDFGQTNTCGASVAAGTNCGISVTFSPTATGIRKGSITVTDDAPGNPHSIPLSGTAIAPEVSMSPTNLTFPAQFVGTSGLPLNITLTNTGSAALTITNVQASSDFAATSGCTSNLAPGVNCSIGVFFDPSASGSRSGTLTITDNAPGSPHTLALTGTGQDFTVTAPTPAVSISAGETASYTLSLAPGGGLNQMATLTCTGAPALATCSVPSTVTLNGASPSTVTVTVSTTASTIAPPGWRPTRPSWPRGAGGGLWWLMALLALGMGTLMQRAHVRGGRAVPRSWLALGTVTLLVALWTACGGGSTNVVHNPGTPAGSYNLTVTATVTSGSSTLNHSASLGLTVH